MATEGQQENLKSRIQKLIEPGDINPRELFQWFVHAQMCLLEAELARIEKREKDAS